MSSVNDGVLLLSGYVRSEAEQALLTLELAKIEGVKAVRSNIAIAPGAGGAVAAGAGHDAQPAAQPRAANSTTGAAGNNSAPTAAPRGEGGLGASSSVPPQLPGEWKYNLDVLTLHADGSYTRATSRADLFAYCGPTMTVATVGRFLLSSNHITLSPTDGSLLTQNSCTGAGNKSPYVNRAEEFVFQLSQNGQSLVLSGPIDSKNRNALTFHKTSQE